MKRRELDRWFRTTEGQWLWRRERALMAPLLSEAFGHHGVEVGTPGADGLLEVCSLGHRVQLSIDDAGDLEGAFRGHLDVLAIRPRSLVVVVLVHVLEFLPAPAAALAAVEQALAPGGRLLVLSFDPVSVAGLRHRLTPGRLPWWPQGAFPARRCGQWLRGLQLDLEHRYRTGRVALTCPDKWQRRLDWIERIAPAWPFGAVYLVSARKRERQGTAIRLGEKLPRRVLAPGMPRPTSNRISDNAA